MKDLSSLRKEYQGRLRRADLAEDPFQQFERWFAAAAASKDVIEPNAMVLATAGADGHVSSRVVLMKGFSRTGVTFVTNYESDKARHIDANPQVALLFFWASLQRQVRIEGLATRAPAEISDALFGARPLGSQISGIVSAQSREVASREEMVKQRELVERALGDAAPTRPPHWGAYVVAPIRFEFWQGGADRLHDRFVYEQVSEGWAVHRLWP